MLTKHLCVLIRIRTKGEIVCFVVFFCVRFDSLRRSQQFSVNT